MANLANQTHFTQNQTFLTLLTALTVPPVLLFATFALSTLLFGLGAAVLFALFWIGIALFFFLLPTLFFAAGCAVFLWTWAVGSFLVARWLSRRTGFDFGFGLFGDGDGEGIGGDKGRLSVREKGGDGDQEVMLKANGEREKGEMKDPADGQVWAYKGPPREERNGIKMEEM
jgi:hypothetical protein